MNDMLFMNAFMAKRFFYNKRPDLMGVSILEYLNAFGRQSSSMIRQALRQTLSESGKLSITMSNLSKLGYITYKYHDEIFEKYAEITPKGKKYLADITDEFKTKVGF